MVKPTGTQSASSTSPASTGASSSSSSSCKYKGVRKRNWGKWVSEIRLPNSRERIWLGSYDSAEKAAKAFDAALYCLRGPHANFNFPDNPPNIVGGTSLRPQQIQAVASRFANEETGRSTPTNDDDNNNNNNNNVVVGEEQCGYTTSSSVVMPDGGGTTQVVAESHELMDWSSYLSMLDNKKGMSDYCFYSGLNDQLYSPPNHDDDQNGGDGFSQSSYLWNF